MQTLEEDLQYVLDLLHKLAFAALTPRNAEQLRDATQCVTDIRDASAIAQEIVWILEDNPSIESFGVELRNGKAQITRLKVAEGEYKDPGLERILGDRLTHVVQICLNPERVNGWSMRGNRSELIAHLEARKFDAAGVLALVAPQWAEQLIHRIDRATSHHKLLHSSRQQLRQPA